MIDSIFAKNLKKIRRKQGLSQDELAKLVGIERKTIIHYETLQNSAKLDTIEDIATALNISVLDLLTDRR